MKRYLLILLMILSIGFFFRTYQIVERFEFAHDADLYSWIVKDILVNNHPRLIGQLTSAPGIFVGSLFYYLIAPFFLLTKMDPTGVLIPITILGLGTIFSYYFVLSKLFSKEAGLIGAFLYAVLIATVSFDRWVVPTVTTPLWTIWYLYTILMITRGNFYILPLLGILIGLIWHIHIALIPILIAVPVSLFVSKKIPTHKQIIYFFVSLFIVSLPLLTFEIRHNFSQTSSLIENFFTSHQGESGSKKLAEVLNMISKNINTLFLSPQSLPEGLRFFFAYSLFLTTLILPLWKRLLSKKEVAALLTWFFGVVGFFTLSSTLISEYYFSNLQTIFLTLVSLTLYFIYKSRVGKILVLVLLAIILFKNLSFYTTLDFYHKGYLEKKDIVKFIALDMKEKKFPCIGVSYITHPGENVGFRYLLYLENIPIVHPSLDVPVYNIVIPDELSKEVKQKFGHIGVIPPDRNPSKEFLEKGCQTPNTNLTDSVFGYVE